jgi:inorganic triphosphatase YgiF
MLATLPTEAYDPDFAGQDIETTYFDTPNFDLRKARVRGSRYLTLRIRRYGGSGPWALSAKTEAQKWRLELDPPLARAYLEDGIPPTTSVLPADLYARWLDIAGSVALQPVAAVCFKRYAVEDARDRLTLDLDVATDTGLVLPFGVLEFKSSARDAVFNTALRPVKLSKFLWSTCP